MTIQNDSTLIFSNDARGNNSFVPGFAATKYIVSLVANTPVSLTIPSNFKVWTAVFCYSSAYTLLVARNATATAAGSGAFVASQTEVMPGPKTVYAGDTLSFLSDSGIPNLGVLLYGIP